MTEAPVQPHVRYCHGCGLYDDAPRIRFIVDSRRPDLDTLHHVDRKCHPDGLVVDASLAPIVAAREDGKKDDELRAFVAEYAPTIPEAPADAEASA